MNRAHAAEIAVGRDDPQRQAEAAVPGAEQRHAKDAGFDEDDAAHVVLRDPILAARHFAQQVLIDRRRVLGRVAPFEQTQPQHDRRAGEGHAQQAESDDLDGQPQGVVAIQAGEQQGEDDAQRRYDGEVERQEQHHRDSERPRVRQRREIALGRQAGGRQATRPGRSAFAGPGRSYPPQQDGHDARQKREQDEKSPGRGQRRNHHAGDREAEEGDEREDEELPQILRPLEPGNSRRRRLREPRKLPEQRGAQLPVNFLSRNAAIGIGVVGAGLRQRTPGRQEESTFIQDPVPLEAAVALMEDAGTMRPLLEVGGERIARQGLGDGVVGRSVAILGTLAAAQHRPKIVGQRRFHLGPEGARRPVEIDLDHEDRVEVGVLEHRHRHEVQVGHLFLEPAVRLLGSRRFLVALEPLEKTGKKPDALRLHVQDDGQDRLPHFDTPTLIQS